MTVLSGQTIRRVPFYGAHNTGQQIISPFRERRTAQGCSYGLGPSGYDIRIAEDLILDPEDFKLASTLERFCMPRNVIGVVHDKSTWIRKGVTVHNTVIEPGWEGYLTLELKNQHMFGFWRRVARSIGNVLRMLDPGMVAPIGALCWLASRIDRPHPLRVEFRAGAPIAQILFSFTDHPVEQPYSGRYQNQAAGAQPAFLMPDGYTGPI